MDPFESWTTFQQMSLFAGIVIFYCVTMTALAVWIAHRQNSRYEAERIRRQRLKKQKEKEEKSEVKLGAARRASMYST